MRTNKPVSTIWFGSYDGLMDNLQKLQYDGLIDFYCFIFHKAEADETKNHFHVYMTPCREFDTEVVKRSFTEFDPVHPDKPIKLVQIVSSKWYDWYWYGLHDSKYLISKRIPLKRFIYSVGNMVPSDDDYFQSLRMATPVPNSQVDSIKEAVVQGVPFEQLVVDGFIPANQYYGYRKQYDDICRFFGEFKQQATVQFPSS